MKSIVLAGIMWWVIVVARGQCNAGRCNAGQIKQSWKVKYVWGGNFGHFSIIIGINNLIFLFHSRYENTIQLQNTDCPQCSDKKSQNTDPDVTRIDFSQRHEIQRSGTLLLHHCSCSRLCINIRLFAISKQLRIYHFY